MKTLEKLSSLFKKLDKAEKLIDKHQKTLQHAPYKAIKKALGKEMMIRNWLEDEILEWIKIVPKELELERLEKEFSQLLNSISIGLIVDFSQPFELEKEITELKKEINEDTKKVGAIS